MAPTRTPPSSTPRRSRRSAEKEALTSKNEGTETPARTSRKRQSADTDDQHDGETAEDTTSAAVLSPREVRQKRREQLRSKATGMISSASPAQNKRVVFDDESEANTATLSSSAAVDDEAHPIPNEEKPDDDARIKAPVPENDNDDDDAVEEMTSKSARREDLERREQERQTARAAASQALTKKKKTRKRKENKAEPDEADAPKGVDESSDVEDAIENMDMDDEFFARLDAARDAERKEKRKRQRLLVEDSAEPTRGKHTTFVVEGDSASALYPESVTRRVDPNVQVVVLPPAAPTHAAAANSIPHAFTAEPVSDAALVYSRSLLLDGSDIMSAKAQQKAKKNGGAKQQPNNNIVPGWKRSKKMLFLASDKSRRKQGAAAPIFTVKK